MGSNMSKTSAPVPVGVFWDIENCHVPSGVPPEKAVLALREFGSECGVIRHFVTCCDMHNQGQRGDSIRRVLNRCGVYTLDVQESKKDAADLMIISDMFGFALDNRPPCVIVMVTTDAGFACALHKLVQRNYTVKLVTNTEFAPTSLICCAPQPYDWRFLVQNQRLPEKETGLSPTSWSTSIQNGSSSSLETRVHRLESSASMSSDEERKTESPHSSRFWPILDVLTRFGKNRSLPVQRLLDLLDKEYPQLHRTESNFSNLLQASMSAGAVVENDNGMVADAINAKMEFPQTSSRAPTKLSPSPSPSPGRNGNAQLVLRYSDLNQKTQSAPKKSGVPSKLSTNPSQQHQDNAQSKSIMARKVDLEAFADVLVGLMKPSEFKLPIHMAQLGKIVKQGCLQYKTLSTLVVFAQTQGLVTTSGDYVDIQDGPSIRLLLNALVSLRKQRVRPDLEAVLTTARNLSSEKKRKASISRKELALVLEKSANGMLLSKLIKQVQNVCEQPNSTFRTLYMLSHEAPYHYVDPFHGVDVYPDSVWRMFHSALSKLDITTLKTASLPCIETQLSTAIRLQKMGLSLSAGNVHHLLTLACSRGAIKSGKRPKLASGDENALTEIALASEDSQLWKNMAKNMTIDHKKNLKFPAELSSLIVNLVKEHPLGIRLSYLPNLIQGHKLRGPKKDFHGFQRLMNLLKEIPCEVRGQSGNVTVYKLTGLYDLNGCEIDC